MSQNAIAPTLARQSGAQPHELGQEVFKHPEYRSAKQQLVGVVDGTT
jgi:hypothetical protein